MMHSREEQVGGLRAGADGVTVLETSATHHTLETQREKQQSVFTLSPMSLSV